MSESYEDRKKEIEHNFDLCSDCWENMCSKCQANSVVLWDKLEQLALEEGKRQGREESNCADCDEVKMAVVKTIEAVKRIIDKLEVDVNPDWDKCIGYVKTADFRIALDKLGEKIK